MRLSLTLGFAALLSAASLHAAGSPQLKKQTKLGHSHSSSELQEAFAGAYNDNDETAGQAIAGTVPATNTYTPIEFPTNQPGTPVNIVHPFAGDDSQFFIRLQGRYLVGWTLTLNIPDAVSGAPATVRVRLVNATTPAFTPFNPDPFETHIVEFNDPRQSVSGQTVLNIAAGTVLQLRVSSDRNITVLNPTFFITRIDD